VKFTQNDVKFTQKELAELLNPSSNNYLKKSAEDKYKDFAKIDPFPDIPDALLNSTDVIKYILTVGMIEPFNPENLDGATYTCNFSGKYKFWDGEGIPNNGEGELQLRSNSIAFLEVEPMFRIPEYLILRFNLKVQHVYKGLLLGTGPIVDPGFQGNLYIPLHNLTSNEYVIKPNAPLICVEFTKLSSYEQRKLKDNTPSRSCIQSLDFSSIPHIFRGIQPRKLDDYIKKALTGDELCRKLKSADNRADIFSVGSSVPEAIKKSEQASKKAEKSAQKSKRLINWIGLGTLIVIIIAAVAAILQIQSIINSVNARIDNIVTQEKYDELKEENEQILQKNQNLQNTIEHLQERIDRLEVICEIH
jgi:deoxycytidine triphosphate deaminase